MALLHSAGRSNPHFHLVPTVLPIPSDQVHPKTHFGSEANMDLLRHPLP